MTPPLLPLKSTDKGRLRIILKSKGIEISEEIKYNLQKIGYLLYA